MAILTSNPDYVTLKTNMNTAIKNFVKNNPNSVKYSTNDAGKAVITLFFGEARDVELKDLAKICMETLNDADFVIEGIPVTVTKSSESYLVFEGEKAAVEAAIKTKAADYPILVIANNQVEDFDADAIVTSIKNGIINTFVESLFECSNSCFGVVTRAVSKNKRCRTLLDIRLILVDSCHQIIFSNFGLTTLGEGDLE